jgi:hypothetical protein
MAELLVESVALRDESVVLGLELLVRRLKLFVLGLEPMMLGAKLLVPSLCFRGFSLDIKLVDGRQRSLFNTGDWRLWLGL